MPDQVHIISPGEAALADVKARYPALDEAKVQVLAERYLRRLFHSRTELPR